MTIKVTITKDSTAAKAFAELMQKKQNFRKAAEEGKLIEYVNKKQERFANPLQPLIPQE